MLKKLKSKVSSNKSGSKSKKAVSHGKNSQQKNNQGDTQLPNLTPGGGSTGPAASGGNFYVDTSVGVNTTKQINVSNGPVLDQMLEDSLNFSNSNFLSNKLNSELIYLDEITNPNAYIIDKEEVQSNVDFGINSKFAEPLAIYTVRKQDRRSLISAAYAAFLEDSCSQEFSKRILGIAKKNDASLFNKANSDISIEILNAILNIQTVEGVFSALKSLDNNFNNKNLDQITANFGSNKNKYPDINFDTTFQSNILKLVNDPKRLLKEIADDPQQILKDDYYSSEQKNQKLMTSIITMLLLSLDESIRSGCTTKILGKQLFKIEPGQLKVSQVEKIQNLITLQDIGLSANVNFLYGIFENGYAPNVSYQSALKIKELKQFHPMRRVAYLSTLVANEFSYSCGLSLSQNFTKYVNKNDDPKKFLEKFIGVNFSNNSAPPSTENFKDALSNFLYVSKASETFSSDVQGSKKIAFLEGSSLNSNNLDSSFETYFEKMLQDPTNQNLNRVETFENLSNEAINAHSDAINFYSQLHLRKGPEVGKAAILSLLNPRKLFSRILKDFGECLNVMTANSSPDTRVQELILMSLLADKETSYVKQYIVSQISKALVIKLKYPKGGAESTIGPNDFDITGNDSLFVNSSAVNPASLPVGVTDELKSFAGFSPEDWPKIDFDANVGILYFSSSFNVVGLPSNYTKIIDILCDLVIETIYLNPNNKTLLSIPGNNQGSRTNFSSTNGLLIAGLIFECWCQLALLFVGAKMSSLPGVGNSKIKVAVKDYKTQNMAARVGLINALANASNSDDFKNFVNKSEINFAPVGKIDVNSSIVTNSVYPLSTKQLLEIFADLNFERDFPAACLLSVKSCYDYMLNSSANVIDIGKQFLNQAKQTQEIQNILNLFNTSAGKKFFPVINEQSLDIAKRRCNKLKDEINSDSARMPKMSLGSYNVIRDTLNDVLFNLGDTNSSNFVVSFVALPKNFVKNSVDQNYSLTDEKNEKTKKLLTINVNAEKRDNFLTTTQFSSKNLQFFARSPLERSSLNYFTGNGIAQSPMNDQTQSTAPSQPKNLSNVVDKILLDNNFNGSNEISKYQNSTKVREILTNEVRSLILSQLFSCLSSADLFIENVNAEKNNFKSEKSKDFARSFSKAYGLPESTFDPLFKANGEIDKNELLNLTKNTVTSDENGATVNAGIISFEEAELFYDLFSTAYFSLGKVNDIVFSPPVLDKILCIVTTESDFVAKGQYEIIKELQFDTYSVEVTKDQYNLKK